MARPQKQLPKFVEKKRRSPLEPYVQIAFNIVALYFAHQLYIYVWRLLTCC